MSGQASITDLREQMEAAAAALDFEQARRLRDRIAVLRAGGDAQAADAAAGAELARQTPGAMGLGTSQQRVSQPKGWRPPPKPDPMTKNRNRR
ncbi:Excinuclease ABC subunit B [Sphingomonas sp. EC-HK361]|uniref:UvrB/UvrC motif-containing protein n=1 Tax=Sphingomonas sp. EC-HK361 TaxID=2038397 RepID=UPI0012585B85|nr:UvrB/UvrC motif-containing protein [Sphingomonas sp. EC-HK361]VVT13158.1 Excinuclease ABC subunit B [Sphingomonas sp. EC-HK361]